MLTNGKDASVDRFRILFEQSSDAHFIFDETGLTDCNEATVKLLKCRSKAEVLSIHPATLSPEFQPDGRRSLEKSIEMDALARTRGSHRFEWVHKKTDGEEFPVQVTLNSVEIDGRPALIAVWHDLTEIKRTEQRLKDLNRRMSAELESAAAFQQSLLPTASPYSDKFRSSWVYKPCNELGGDSLNIFRIDESHIGLYVLDVTGHGVASALLSVTATHFLSGFLKVRCPREVVSSLNQHFSNERYANHSFTLVYGVMDLDSLTFEYTSAGHLGPIKLKNDASIEQFDSHGPPVGMIEDAAYGQSRIACAPGERLFLISDGVYEARNAKGQELGLEAVYRQLSKEFKGRCPLSFTVDSMALAAYQWCLPDKPGDDISILGVEFKRVKL